LRNSDIFEKLKEVSPSVPLLKKEETKSNFASTSIVFLFITTIAVLYTLPSYAQEDVWLLIDTQKQELEVKQANVTLQKFSNISIGRNGLYSF